LLDSEALHTVNHTTIAAVFDNSMKLLWEGEVKRENILFVADVAAYMVKAAMGGSLEVSYTCST
jgi:hypothetical protein